LFAHVVSFFNWAANLETPGVWQRPDHTQGFMKISAVTLNKKINGFLSQLEATDQYVILYPSDIDPERAKTVAKAKGWKGSSRDVLMPCYSLNDVVLRRLA